MAKSLDRLTLLETFARIAERGSISAAALDLGLSQASASRHLQDLESRLGAVLIRRTTHTLKLTDAGKSVLRDTRPLLQSWDALTESVSDNDRIAGTLRVVAPLALGQSHLAAIASDFLRRHPDVHLVWELSDEPINVAERGCDVWLRIGPVPDDRLIVRPLATVTRSYVATPELASQPNPPLAALAPYEGNRFELRDADGGTRSVKSNASFITNTLGTLATVIRSGTAAGILPDWEIAEDLRTGKLTHVVPEFSAPSLNLSACYLPAARQPKRLTAFLSSVAEGLGQVPGITPTHSPTDT